MWCVGWWVTFCSLQMATCLDSGNLYNLPRTEIHVARHSRCNTHDVALNPADINFRCDCMLELFATINSKNCFNLFYSYQHFFIFWSHHMHLCVLSIIFPTTIFCHISSLESNPPLSMLLSLKTLMF